MGERRLRTSQRRKRAKARFWDAHGNAIRLTLIGGGMVLLASCVAKLSVG
jgi:hypothetical protein